MHSLHCLIKQSLNIINILVTCGDEESLALLYRTPVTLVHLISKKHFILVRRAAPALKQGQVGLCRLYQVEDLLSLAKNK